MGTGGGTLDPSPGQAEGIVETELPASGGGSSGAVWG